MNPFGSIHAAMHALALAVNRLATVVGDCRMSQSPAVTLKDINEMEQRIMASQKELAEDLSKVLAQLKKTASEIKGVQTTMDELKQKIIDLEEVINAGGDASPDLVAAVQAVKDQAQVVDDAIPDPVVVPTPTP
jgi:peptidoglycan hydrolase CwlO-like protein